MLVVAAAALAHTAAHAGLSGVAQIEDSQRRVRVLLERLDAIDEQRDPDTRRELLIAHWSAAAKLFPAQKRNQGSVRCTLASDADISAYLAGMKDLLWEVRVRLVELHEAPADVSETLGQLAERTDRGLREIRARGYRNGKATPREAMASLPDSGSEGAYVLGHYCTQCHGAPAPALHTAAEWNDVLTKMETHAGLANMAEPSAALQFSPRSLALMQKYLTEHACDAR